VSFPAYPAYRESGVEWVGLIPEAWKPAKLKHIVDPQRPITYGIVQAGADVPDGTPYIRPADMSDEGGVSVQDGLLRTTRDIAATYARSMIRAGDLVCSIGPSFGKVMIVPASLHGANLTQGTARVAIDSSQSARYFFWVLRSSTSVSQWQSGIGGATFGALNLTPLANTWVSLPSLPEQSAIAAFLDRETGKIDGLVAEQERLIGLLREKWQAVISHAVTKGLDPHAPMKDSGVEWLGQVPAHWEVTRLGYRYEVQLGRMLNEARSQGDDLRPYVRVFDVQWGRINVEDLPLMDFPPDARARYLLEPGDLLVNEGGSYVGRSAIWHGEIAECYYQKALHRVRPLDHDGDTTAFLYYVMELATRLGAFVAGGNQTTIDHLTAEKLRAHRFAFPPRHEQDLIAEVLEHRLLELDTLTAEAHRAIALLRERRAALISAAVTGKIDVRGLVAPEKAQAA
jgi:type I restriction enzyme S subunit